MNAILIGAGSRGREIYGAYALAFPEKMKIVAVCEPNERRRSRIMDEHKISSDMGFLSYEDLLCRPKIADLAIISTLDQQHFEPTCAALNQGYHVLLEKPMSNNPIECKKMVQLADKCNKHLMICHVLRYTPFYQKIKSIVDSGIIGDIVGIDQNENIGYWHMAHSFVRGNFRKEATSSPIILAKCCHDLDIISWIIGKKCKSINSFGANLYFNKEHSPNNSPEYCLDGCGEKNVCPYYAPNLYLTEATDWPTSMISEDTSYEERKKALKKGPYGRCVFKCDNDVMDYQTVQMLYEDNVMASFTMSAFTVNNTRTLKIMGTKGEIRAHMQKSEISYHLFKNEEEKVIQLKKTNDAHGGGDFAMLDDVTRIIDNDIKQSSLTSAKKSLESHLIAFSAEISRKENRRVYMESYLKEPLAIDK